ncbi:MAG: Mov34/MPN/PAD-1 family protein [Ekhidna sp.]|uniref:Mov34/MPN/PAD-1 family protein n=1 Tax=Reichenbachiella sp. TaxID=2184521 RepID=UPI0032662732
MIAKMTNNGRLKISEEALIRMNQYKQDSNEKFEAGGVVLGRFIKDFKDVIVDRITVPMIGDVRGRTFFIRGEKRHQQVITNAWIKSNGTCNYLGEWHTHPESYPTPSGQDIKNWKEILSTRTFSSLYLYFIIVGTHQVRIWEGNRKTGKIKRLYR